MFFVMRFNIGIPFIGNVCLRQENRDYIMIKIKLRNRCTEGTFPVGLIECCLLSIKFRCLIFERLETIVYVSYLKISDVFFFFFFINFGITRSLLILINNSVMNLFTRSNGKNIFTLCASHFFLFIFILRFFFQKEIRFLKR